MDVYNYFRWLGGQNGGTKGTQKQAAVYMGTHHEEYNSSLMIRFFFLLTALTFLAGCSKNPTPLDFASTAETFLNTTLSFSPVTATAAGYHTHKGVPLDQVLDDMSEQGLNNQRVFYIATRTQLAKFPIDLMDAAAKADIAIIRNQVELAMLELDEIKAYKHNPTIYVELVGNALFPLHVLEFAPKEKRFESIIARLEKVPALLSQAKDNLTSSPEIWNQVAREENEGNISLIDVELRNACPAAMRANFDKAAALAIAALKDFQKYLETDLSKKTSDWRLGPTLYAKKFRYSLAVEGGPGTALTEAETAFRTIHNEMALLAAPGKVKTKLDQIAQRQTTVERFFDTAKADLAQTRAFVKSANLLPLPPRDNLQVIATPEFMRGIYSVGGFNSAPPLEPQLGAYYWITPIPNNWPAARIQSKLREYNNYALKLLTIHEAMPGHYVQQEFANNVEPKWRRALRSVYSNGPYVEGWAVYITEQMLDAGYLDKSPELRLTFLKQQLRMIANTILDIRLHTLAMPDSEAMTLMIDGAFQEREEASGKLRRAKLSSCQLPTYFLGYKEWKKLNKQLTSVDRQMLPAAFHGKALALGAVPMTEMFNLMNDRTQEASK